MRLPQGDMQRLLERVRDSTRVNFSLACVDLFSYLDERVPDNEALLELNQEREAKWRDFPPRRPAGWRMPTVKADRESLAYDLFRRIAELREDGRGLLFHMYRKNFVHNVDAFRDDFLQYFADALTRIGRAEPTQIQADGREKQQKFKILDAPNLLMSDLEGTPGMFGRAVIYFDLDNFKAINSQFTERLVDETVLPTVQRLVAAAVANQGYAYAEGGDEMIVLLPNSTLAMGAAFADALRAALSQHVIVVRDESVTVTASFGVAAGNEGKPLAELANLAKNYAKASGKNCVAISIGGSTEIWKDASTAARVA